MKYCNFEDGDKCYIHNYEFIVTQSTGKYSNSQLRCDGVLGNKFFSAMKAIIFHDPFYNKIILNPKQFNLSYKKSYSQSWRY